MTDWRIAVLPGDGIGPEVTAEAIAVLDAVARHFGWRITNQTWPIGAQAALDHGEPFPRVTRDAVTDADAVFLGAVGDPVIERQLGGIRPEAGLLALRVELGGFANLRPVAVHPALTGSSPLRPEVLAGTDLLVVRELTGGLYYGEPRGRDADQAVNTLRYSAREIERVARIAFDAARKRKRFVTSVDKANVLEVSQLWREVVNRVARDYSDVRVEHLYVDHAAMRLVAEPSSLDVVLTENLFGDILSDEAAVLVGSLGLLPSASIGGRTGLFEPVHGSAPALAGRGIANPVGAILSVAMLLRYGLRQAEAADMVERAVASALSLGVRTADIAAGLPAVSTKIMGEVIRELLGQHATATARSNDALGRFLTQSAS